MILKNNLEKKNKKNLKKNDFSSFKNVVLSIIIDNKKFV